MNKALYIATITLKLRRKKDRLVIIKDLNPVILDDQFRMPKEDEKFQLKRMVRDRINVAKFDEWIISYEISNAKFSSKLYQPESFKMNN